jgi:hypothetical protein
VKTVVGFLQEEFKAQSVTSVISGSWESLPQLPCLDDRRWTQRRVPQLWKEFDLDYL